MWALSALLALGAVAVVLGLARSGAPLDGPFTLAWWHLALLTIASERFAIHIEYRRDAHAFTFTDAVLVVGLLTAAPVDLVVGVVLGTAVALAFEQRKSLTKAGLNVASCALTVALAAAVFELLRSAAGGLDVHTGVAAMAGVAVSHVGGVLAVSGAVALLEAGVDRQQLRVGLSLGLLAGLANASTGLLVVLIAYHEPAGAWFLLLPVATLLVAYHGYTRQRQQRQATEFLYEVSRALVEAGDHERALGTLTELVCAMFRARCAEVLMFPTGAGDRGVRIGAATGRAARALPPRPLEDVKALARWVGPTLRIRRARLDQGDGDALARYTRGEATAEALAVPLLGADGVSGLLIVADRSGGGHSRFDATDEQLLGAIGNQVNGWLRAEQVEHSLAKLNLAKERLHHQAYHDDLTDLANRTQFNERLGEAAQRCPAGHGFAVLLVNLDDFKAVNDRHGHARGDMVIVRLAERIRSSVRPQDTVARMGGDEFAVILDGVRNPREAEGHAERLLRTLDQPVEAGDVQVRVPASIGFVVAAPGAAVDPDGLMRNADVALHRAKSAGKRRVQRYVTGMDVPLLRHLELGAGLRQALERSEVEVHYQPIIDLEAGAVAGFEALMRWTHPTYGRVSPTEFVPLAEERGIIVELGQWVLAQACAQLRTWQAHSRGTMSVNVNLSPVQLEHPDVVDDIEACLRSAGVEPRDVVLEVTESVLMRDRGLAALRALWDLGLRLALDDFGTGFSSLSYLDRLPLDIVKVPREFVARIGEGGRQRDLTGAVVGLARSLALDVVAEGVETRLQVAELRRYGCGYAQGFWFARPAPAPALARFLDGRAVPSAS